MKSTWSRRTYFAGDLHASEVRWEWSYAGTPYLSGWGTTVAFPDSRIAPIWTVTFKRMYMIQGVLEPFMLKSTVSYTALALESARRAVLCTALTRHARNALKLSSPQGSSVMYTPLPIVMSPAYMSSRVGGLK